MKIAHFGESSTKLHLIEHSPSLSDIFSISAHTQQQIDAEKAAEEARKLYYEHRLNGDKEDYPYEALPRDGKWEWTTPTKEYSAITYIPGIEARKWMEDKDLEYISKLFNDKTLVDKEPNLIAQLHHLRTEQQSPHRWYEEIRLMCELAKQQAHEAPRSLSITETMKYSMGLPSICAYYLLVENIQELVFYQCLKNGDIDHLLTHLPKQLRTLNLSNNTLTLSTLTMLLGSNLPASLKAIDLSNNYIAITSRALLDALQPGHLPFPQIDLTGNMIVTAAAEVPDPKCPEKQTHIPNEPSIFKALHLLRDRAQSALRKPLGIIDFLECNFFSLDQVRSGKTYQHKLVLKTRAGKKIIINMTEEELKIFENFPRHPKTPISDQRPRSLARS